MVYASVPSYLDPPNWNQHQQQPERQQQQQQQQQQALQAGGSGRVGVGTGVGGEAHQLPHLGAAPPGHEGGSTTAAGSVRPGSMANRTRLAKVPQPEPALKCPRCESTNTKFCYFNNYSLTQPRHFCKTCRRYWTRGGALRNVPVGGGCRRNKRSKNSTSKSSGTDRQSGNASATAGALSAMAGGSGAIASSLPPPQLPFMGSFHSLADYGTANLGLNYAGVQTIDPVDFQVGSSPGGIGLEQWRLQHMQQFPFFTGLEQPAGGAAVTSLGLYPFDGEGGVDGSTSYTGQVHGKATAAGLITQLASVKMEEHQRQQGGLNLPRQYLGIHGSDQFWGTGGSSNLGAGGGNGAVGSSSTGGAAWADLSGFCSTGNLL